MYNKQIGYSNITYFIRYKLFFSLFLLLILFSLPFFFFSIINMTGTFRWHSCSTSDFPLKRHKVSKACEVCRAKKMRCDGSNVYNYNFLLFPLFSKPVYVYINHLYRKPMSAMRIQQGDVYL